MFRFFENLINPFAPFAQTTPPDTLWAYLRSHYAPFKKLMVAMGLTGILVAVIEAGLIFYLGHVIDLMNASSPDAFWSRYGVEMLLAVLFIICIRPLAILLNRAFLEQGFAGNMQPQVLWRSHKYLLGQSVGFFQNDFAGRVANRVMQLRVAVEDLTFMFFEGIWYALAYVVSAAVILSQTDYRLAVPLLVWVLVYAAYVRWISGKVAVASERFSDARSMVTGRIVDSYSNIESVKLFAHGGREETYALSAVKRFRLRLLRFVRLMTTMSFGLTLLNGFLIVTVLGMAVWLWSVGQVSIGQVAAASALTVRLNGMSGWIMWLSIRIFEQIGVVREGLQSVSVPHSVVDRPNAPALALSAGRIEFRDISHHYGRKSGGLDHVSLTIPAGQKLGLIGRSGAGKSSLVNLLLRFRDAESGQVLIDGQDISTVTQDSLRAVIGVVSQDSSLLHRSVRDNILYGKPDATEAELRAAAKCAQADDFIQTLSDPGGRTGYQAQVGERGVKLSGGQRQRIAIARVMLKNAPILVLDEATSALDSEAELAIQSALDNMMQGKTVIAIAHRLSTIARMDRIIVLDQGRIVEDGDHDSLLRQNGIYADLWQHQSGGFLGG
ncbi:MAG: multidrug ABC transporter ATP-binding protein [Rhodobacterales bacterium]|nr:MAG: multidrug ABC transporter ATP-binding protein [Rhodobacterales bacterium]